MSFQSALLLLFVTSPALLVGCSAGLPEDDFLRPPVPDWPEVFSVQFYVYVQQYGAEWNSTGMMFYHWASKTFRSDFIKWCLPLFDSGSTEFDNYTCSFLATNGNMYFVNHTSEKWEDNDCCLFEKGLGAVAPDWMMECDYNGTTTIKDTLCDVWWFPGTSDPNKPCYGYWNSHSEPHIPVQFFGLSSLGPTILDYHDFAPGKIPPDTNLQPPNSKCERDCEPPRMKMKTIWKFRNKVFTDNQKESSLHWPEWPSCG